MESRRIVIACGGSGGHLAPGIALAEEGSMRGYQPVLFVSSKTVDRRMLAKYSSWQVVSLPAEPLLLTPWKFLRFCHSQVISFAKTLYFLMRNPTEAIIVMGGFISLSVAVAGFLKRIPIFIHESNRIPGKITRWLAVLAKRIYVPKGCAIPQAEWVHKIRNCGYPLRSEFSEAMLSAKNASKESSKEGLTLVLLGGSQGAKALNDWFCEHVLELKKLVKNLVCVTGQAYYEEHKEVLEPTHQASPNIRFLSFCDDMPSLLAEADVVIARAGAGTIAECMYCETPMILVPLPSAADDHQQANAEWAQKLGCAYVVKEAELDFLFPLVKWITASPGILAHMQHQIRTEKEEDVRKPMMNDILGILAGEDAREH
ncbi:MAG: UDP-N-acetylglucosamine--N-acetylmuramyl-(pentapeptide) pyrophosphoryl-undecaprenol N-acetylglucosamine transferase [Puniceicoccales bacterium]|jgi:UDP-N-acetylglucosamine--N-acetylmuramyl-(pentapeptide) pyrophosphoryl-undecaprenol N-acetylglucosamine transferase|nr:UDP-N-acetylglucosamine--N-acetylmuramyl-(pentapeptide) pyrophosphoryl-undecaprenol N-acetylglucosamine transferase [Puniceicoccales bacterium]